MNLDDYNPEEVELSKRKQETIITKEDSLWKNLQFRGFVSNMCSGTLSEEDEKKLVEVLQKIDEYPSTEYLKPLIVEFSNIMADEASRTRLEQIGLRVVSEEHMLYRNSKPNCSYNKTDFPTEYYGYYYSYNNEIVLCPERIMKAPLELQKKHVQITSQKLYLVVLVHALAHALMDPTRNKVSYQPLINIKNGFTERDVLMEESLANMITLQYFDIARQKGIISKSNAFEKEFINAQPLAYSFGLDQFTILNPKWQLWREHKEKMSKFTEKK